MYKANVGGHAPNHLRDAFLKWIEHHGSEVRVDDEPRPLRWLQGQLWNCTDTLPGGYCDELDLPQGSSYAQAVRSL